MFSWPRVCSLGWSQTPRSPWSRSSLSCSCPARASPAPPGPGVNILIKTRRNGLETTHFQFWCEIFPLPWRRTRRRWPGCRGRRPAPGSPAPSSPGCPRRHNTRRDQGYTSRSIWNTVFTLYASVFLATVSLQNNLYFILWTNLCVHKFGLDEGFENVKT